MSGLTNQLTPLDVLDTTSGVRFAELGTVSSGLVSSRSGYEAAENRQKGADSPIFSLLKAIYIEPTKNPTYMDRKRKEKNTINILSDTYFSSPGNLPDSKFT